MKKNNLITTILFFIALISLVFTPYAFATEGYLMFCHTGGKMQVKLEPGSKGDTYIFIDYVKSKVKYDLNNPKLNPGECAWKDRPLNSEEPTRLHYLANMNISSQFNTSGTGKAKMTAGSINDNATQRAKLQRFLDSVMNDNYFTVRAARKNSNIFFYITSFE